MDDSIFKIARIEGDFIWHKHDDADEVFIEYRKKRAEPLTKQSCGE